MKDFEQWVNEKHPEYEQEPEAPEQKETKETEESSQFVEGVVKHPELANVMRANNALIVALYDVDPYIEELQPIINKALRNAAELYQELTGIK